MPDFRPIRMIIGVFVALLGLLMLLPAAADLVAGSDDWAVFAASSAISIFVGGGLWTSGRTGERLALTIRQAFLLTALSWTTISAFAALPFIWADLGLSTAEAFFEATSGITTTGGTVLTGLDNLPPGILLWRAILHFYGGIGVVVVAIAVLPMLRVGGMQLFRAESSDRSEKIFPAAAQIAGSIFGVYLTLNLACAVAYILAGMTPFEALLYGMSTVATGGFGANDTSIGYFQSAAIEWIAIVFMIAASVPFVLYIHAIRGRPGRFLRSTEVRFYLAVILSAALMLWIYVEARGLGDGGGSALRWAFFHVVSLVSTTGLVTQDYALWGPFSDAVFFALLFIGGCTGSTSGGIKALRFLVLGKAVAQQMRRMLYPNGVFPLIYEGNVVSDEVVRSIAAFVLVYIGFFFLLTMGVAVTDLDFRSALSAVAANISNAGPGLGPIVGPVGNYNSLSDFALWLLALAMLMGRLEIFTILILFLPRFWRP